MFGRRRRRDHIRTWAPFVRKRLITTGVIRNTVSLLQVLNLDYNLGTRYPGTHAVGTAGLALKPNAMSARVFRFTELPVRTLQRVVLYLPGWAIAKMEGVSPLRHPI